MSKNQNQKEKVLPKNLKDHKQVKLFFAEDKLYKGEVVYKKGEHQVETKDGWAARWIARGAKLVVDGDRYDVTADASSGEIVYPEPKKDLVAGAERVPSARNPNPAAPPAPPEPPAPPTPPTPPENPSADHGNKGEGKDGEGHGNGADNVDL